MTLRNLLTLDDKRIDLSLEPLLPRSGKKDLVLEEALIFPGLINSHDHLDFNLFPMLGSKKYASYTEWGPSIHALYKHEIREVLAIPQVLRTQWGLYKNLLCGVTTVINHGPRLPIPDPFIRVCQDLLNIHSVAFEKHWRRRLMNPFNRRPCVIHTGEGTDTAAHAEINSLIRWNLLQKKLIGIHGVAMSPEQSAKFAALVWCPLSNFFLLGTTASIKHMNTTILLGSDSVLTGSWNFWDHLRFARETGLADQKEIIDMVTSRAAAAWRVPGYNQELPPDLVIARTGTGKAIDQFFKINPADILLVIQSGAIRLMDESLYDQLRPHGLPAQSLSKVMIDGRLKYVPGNLPSLIQEIRQYHQGALFPVQIPEA
ncbi:MAG TPA: hypothetical protein VFR58_09660 [Flavisolibacter sp.]|nr:hypothetical protein [Flavisolibacter sp.]